jgi:ribosome-binding factor A
MSSRRLLKAAQAIREVVSMAILTEVRDPRVQHVTVISVEVAPDMKSAQVNVSIMGSEKEQQLALSGLRHSAGFLQQRIADRIDTRYTPRLSFAIDKGAKNALEVHRILSEVLPKPPVVSGDTLDDDQTIGEHDVNEHDIDEQSIDDQNIDDHQTDEPDDAVR